MALNKMGIIVNFVHPLLPPESVEEILEFTESKGVMMLDMFAPKYASMLKKTGLPVVLCSPKEYAYPDKTACPIDETALLNARIFVSAGVRGAMVGVEPQALAALVGAQFLDLTEL